VLTTEADQVRAESKAHQLDALEAAVWELHSSSTPEWIHWPARCGAGYGAWLLERGSKSS
jgi:uncharacterized protein involved in tolerance to divalent cations